MPVVLRDTLIDRVVVPVITPVLDCEAVAVVVGVIRAVSVCVLLAEVVLDTEILRELDAVLEADLEGRSPRVFVEVPEGVEVAR